MHQEYSHQIAWVTNLVDAERARGVHQLLIYL